MSREQTRKTYATDDSHYRYGYCTNTQVMRIHREQRPSAAPLYPHILHDFRSLCASGAAR